MPASDILQCRRYSIKMLSILFKTIRNILFYRLALNIERLIVSSHLFGLLYPKDGDSLYTEVSSRLHGVISLELALFSQDVYSLEYNKAMTCNSANWITSNLSIVSPNVYLPQTVRSFCSQ